jgi:CheY-like chemotaxis protein
MGVSSLKNILVIDDNDTDLLIAKIVIEKSGFVGKITTRSSGKSALEYVNSIINTPEEWPDVIFLDINMPVVSGFGFIEGYEKIGKTFTDKVKIAVLSSSDNKSDMERFASSGYVIDFVPKPLSIEGFKLVAEKF